MSTVLYLAALADIEKCAPYSGSLVRGCVKSFPAFTNTTKDSAALLWVRRYVDLSVYSFMRLNMLVFIPC